MCGAYFLIFFRNRFATVARFLLDAVPGVYTIWGVSIISPLIHAKTTNYYFANVCFSHIFPLCALYCMLRKQQLIYAYHLNKNNNLLTSATRAKSSLFPHQFNLVSAVATPSLWITLSPALSLAVCALFLHLSSIPVNQRKMCNYAKWSKKKKIVRHTYKTPATSKMLSVNENNKKRTNVK